MPSIKLSSQQQTDARNVAVQAANLGYQHEPDVHYTQGSSRWQGIDNKLVAANGQYPNYADCSSYVTWCIWQALYLPYGMEDVVNASGWDAGYTGTMLNNGTSISKASDLLPGDAVIYGAQGSTGSHTAIVVQAGSTPMCISHGSEGGPYRVAYNYRSDIQAFRRYIDGNSHQAERDNPDAPVAPPADDDLLAVVVKQDGREEIFALTGAGEVKHAYQTAANGGWSGSAPGKAATWYSLGKP